MLENNIKLLFWVAIVGLLQNAPITAQSFTNPLLIPPTMSGTTFNLSIAASTKQFTSGINTPTFGINGNYLAPTLVFQKGDVVNMNVSNNISEETTLHWHGLHVPSETDGSPHNIIAPNSTWAVHFQIKNAASTNWYHPHPHQNTVTHVTKGLAGMIIVHDNIESQLNLPRTYGTDDLPIILQDRSFSGSDLVTTGTSAALSDLMTVNGTLSPFVDCPAQVVRLRVLNGSNARVYNLGFNDNRSFQVIASDGGLLAQPFSTTRLVIANGERYEILVNLSADLNQDLYLKSYGNELAASVPGGGTGMMNGTSPLNAASFDMLRFHVVAATANPITTIPSVLTTVTPINPAMANVTRVKTLAGNGMVAMGNFTINGRQFDINYVNDVVNLNDTEIWEINNTTNIAHPFHIHDVQFYVLSRNGSAPPAYESALKDVVLVNSGETVRFIAKFEDFASTTPYMYHCHNLLHEDGGMMGQFVVSAPTIPVELVDFSAKKQAQDALLSWETASEQNNKGYSIERSTDARNWSNLAFVKGAGDSHTPRYYSNLDKNPPNQLLYYRLKQLDFDGKETPSKIVTLDFSKNTNCQLKVYPNPTTGGNVSVEITDTQNPIFRILVFNSIGQQVYQQAFTQAVSKLSLPNLSLPMGNYFLKIETQKGSMIEKLIFTN